MFENKWIAASNIPRGEHPEQCSAGNPCYDGRAEYESTVEGKGQVPEVLDTQDDLLSELAEEIQALWLRLQPIMHDRIKNGEEGQELIDYVPVASRIYTSNKQIAECIRMIRVFRNSIEI